jgi:hypothetical protein
MRAPAFQFYPKQWLGDDKVMAMSWDARAMHMHLICIAWQQDPPCTLPDDDLMIRRWLGNPKKWEDLRNQIFAAWKMVDGRWIQKGLLEQFERQTGYRESRKKGSDARWGNNAYASPNSCINDALLSSSSSSTSFTSENPTPRRPKSGHSELAPVPLLEVVVFELPLSDKSVYGVPQSLYSEYVNLYPGVNVMAQLAAMRGWLISNPRKGKTRRGITAFMANWLNNEQNRNGGKSNGGSNGKSALERIQELATETAANRAGSGSATGDHRQTGEHQTGGDVGKAPDALSF